MQTREKRNDGPVRHEEFCLLGEERPKWGLRVSGGALAFSRAGGRGCRERRLRSSGRRRTLASPASLAVARGEAHLAASSRAASTLDQPCPPYSTEKGRSFGQGPPPTAERGRPRRDFRLARCHFRIRWR